MKFANKKRDNLAESRRLFIYTKSMVQKGSKKIKGSPKLWNPKPKGFYIIFQNNNNSNKSLYYKYIITR